MKAYNWTYRDLLNVTRPALVRPGPTALNSAVRTSSDSALRIPHSALKYPIAREQDFATYCVNILGLRKTVKGRTAINCRPPGYEIAAQLCPALASNT